MPPAGSNAAEVLGIEGFGSDNLPFGSCQLPDGRIQLCVRLGDHALPLDTLSNLSPGLDDPARSALRHPNLDLLLAAGRPVWSAVRNWLRALLEDPAWCAQAVGTAYPVNMVHMRMPFTVGDYVDFYASEEHASNVGRIFRPDEAPLKPNWKHLPVGYHGRSGTIRVSGSNVRRPKGLRAAPEGPVFGPSQKLDIEVELGFVCGGSAPDGEVGLQSAASDHLFGVVLLNDWSARDIQAFEYVPLGPNLGKSFATSISAWVVSWDALADARVPPPERSAPLASYLDDAGSDPYGLAIALEVEVDGHVISRPHAETLYWTAPQMVAHMTVNNASLRPGDFFGSGTISGALPTSRGSLLELTWDGRDPIVVGDGRTMTFLEDGQEVVLRGTARTAAGSVISLTECRATILPATQVSR